MTTTYVTVDGRARLLDVTSGRLVRQTPAGALLARVVAPWLQTTGDVRPAHAPGSVITVAVLDGATDMTDPADLAVSQQTASGTRTWSPPV